jgi:transcriptional regulator with XRE-family HTH domain
MTNFAEKLKAARKAAQLTQQGMADRMEIPRRTIQDWEANRMTPPPYVQRFVLNELESVNRRCKNCKWYEAKDPAPVDPLELPAWCSNHEETWPEDFCSYWTPKK